MSDNNLARQRCGTLEAALQTLVLAVEPELWHRCPPPGIGGGMTPRASYTLAERALLYGMAIGNPETTFAEAARYVPHLDPESWRWYRRAAAAYRQDPARMRGFLTKGTLDEHGALLGYD